LIVGESITIVGHEGNAANLAMNQVYVVKTITSPTVTVLTGTGMSTGVYSTGTITATQADSLMVQFSLNNTGTLGISATEQASVTSNAAINSAETTLTHAAFTRPLVVGEMVTVSGHNGTEANLKMNQEYFVKNATDATHTVLTGSGMTAGTYNTGTIVVATTPAALDFEKSQTYNVEVAYIDAGSLASETRVMYLQLWDINEAPTITSKIAMTEDAGMTNWYAISQHKKKGSDTCKANNEDHYCHTGQCVVTSTNLAITGDYCNELADCSVAGSTCKAKVIKSNAFDAKDQDVDTTLTYAIINVWTTKDTIGGTPTWTPTNTTIFSINVDNGDIQETLASTGPGTDLCDLNTKYKVAVKVSDGATGGDATYKSTTANKWDAKSSSPDATATNTVYFKTILTNTFPVFTPATQLSLTIREDADDQFVIPNAIHAQDVDPGAALTWELGTLSGGQKMIPTMADNSGAGVASSLRGDKFAFVSMTGINTSNTAVPSAWDNNIKLVGDGIDFERDWGACSAVGCVKPFVNVQALVDDGNGGTAIRNIKIEIKDVNEQPSWKQSAAGFSIAVQENDPIAATTRSPGANGLTDFVATDVDISDNQTYTLEKIMAGTAFHNGTFTIDKTSRVITLAKALNYETVTSYTLTVRVTDRGAVLGRVGSTLFSETTVQVSVLDQNEPPTMAAATMTQREDQAAFAFRFDLATKTTDDDEGRTQFTWTKMAETPLTLDMFEVNAATGLLKLREEYLTLDFENVETHTITVNVTDGWKNIYDTASNQQQDTMVDSADLMALATYRIDVTDINDIGVPALDKANYRFSTNGGDFVVLNAKNLGPTDFKCAAATCTVGANGEVEYNVTYGPDPKDANVALDYTATGCIRLSGNTQIQCQTVAGIGKGHVWQISVRTNGAPVPTVSERSTMTSSYNRPTLSTVGVAAKHMPTVGGRTLTFHGKDMGPVGSPAAVFYVSDAGAVVGGNTKYMKYPGE